MNQQADQHISPTEETQENHQRLNSKGHYAIKLKHLATRKTLNKFQPKKTRVPC